MELLSLDVGDKRIGVARANAIARLAEPLTTIAVDGEEIRKVIDIIEESQVRTVVIGLPRGQEGQKTQQTSKTEAFAKRLQEKSPVTIEFQDESLTSQLADEMLKAHQKRSSEVDQDQLAAVLILEDYLERIA